jgi:hypothetical protein
MAPVGLAPGRDASTGLSPLTPEPGALHRLRHQLRKRDLAALATYRQLQPVLRALLEGESSGRLDAAVADLDFDAALALLPAEHDAPHG